MMDANGVLAARDLSFLEIMSVVISFRIKHRLKSKDILLGMVSSLKAHGSKEKATFIDLYVGGSYWNNKAGKECSIEVTDFKSYYYAGVRIICRRLIDDLKVFKRPNQMFNVLPKRYLIAHHDLINALNSRVDLTPQQREELAAELARIAGKQVVANPTYSIVALHLHDDFRRCQNTERRLIVEDVEDAFEAIVASRHLLQHLKQRLVEMAVFIRRHKTDSVYRWNNDPLGRDVSELIKFIALLLPSEPKIHLPSASLLDAWFIVRSINKDVTNWTSMSERYQLFAGPMLVLIMAIVVKLLKDKAAIDVEITGIINRINDASSLSQFTIKNAGV